MEGVSEPKPLSFTVFGEPLNNLLIAIGNRLSHQWPAQYSNVVGARELFVMHVRAVHITYLSALYLCGDVPPDPRRKTEFCISLPLLNRSLVDILSTLVFILEDLPNRCQWFHEAGWREARLELDRYTTEYGNLPEWKSWLSELNQFVNVGPHLVNLTPQQTANPKGLRSWPTLGNMWNFGSSSGSAAAPSRTFLKYLNDFFYIDLSQQAHLAAWGMIKRTGFLLDEIKEIHSSEAGVRKYKLFQLGQIVALSLAVASEIEVHFDFGLRQEALFVWGVASSGFEIVNEMYGKRYRELLTP
jgi:hypothetical protein